MFILKHDTRNIYNSGHFAHEQSNDYHRISRFGDMDRTYVYEVSSTFE